MSVTDSIVDLPWWRFPYPGAKDDLKQKVERILLSHQEAELTEERNMSEERLAALEAAVKEIKDALYFKDILIRPKLTSAPKEFPTVQGTQKDYLDEHRNVRIYYSYECACGTTHEDNVLVPNSTPKQFKTPVANCPNGMNNTAHVQINFQR
jgi:hypothetical protein